MVLAEGEGVERVGAGVRAALGHTLDVRPWLDLVALGTVADVMPLASGDCSGRKGLSPI